LTARRAGSISPEISSIRHWTSQRNTILNLNPANWRDVVMSEEPISKHKTRIIVASLVATVYLGAMMAATSVETALHQPGPAHPRWIANSRSKKHIPHPSPWMFHMTAWVVSMAAQFS
jgi:hypothetical protein